MAYIPVIIAAAQPSARTRELSKAIVQLVHTYRKNEPVTSDTEVQHALQLATAELKAGSAKREGTPMVKVILLIIGLSVLMLGFAAALWFSGIVD
ncbi:MAG: hypothetical protein GY835_27295 [bacterium]|nr:hypothetical protein [bacterium]